LRATKNMDSRLKLQKESEFTAKRVGNQKTEEKTVHLVQTKNISGTKSKNLDPAKTMSKKKKKHHK